MNHLYKKERQQTVIRGGLYYANLSPVVGSEQGGVRPVLVIQNNLGNRHSPTVIVAAITSRTTKALLPTHIEISQSSDGLKQDSTVLTEQIRTIDRRRLREYIGHLDPEQMDAVDEAVIISLGLPRRGHSFADQAMEMPVVCNIVPESLCKSELYEKKELPF